MALKISSRLVGDVLILDLTGSITLGEGSNILRDAIKRVVAEGNRKILLNIADVNYLDSSGLETLVGAYIGPRKQGGELKLLSPTRKVRDLLQITKLYTVFDVCANETQAVESFALPELRCCCPVCGSPAGEPALDVGRAVWPPQVCRNARCEARFTVVSSESKSQALVKSARIQTFANEYVELLPGPPITMKIVGRLVRFSAPALKKAWQAIPVPRRVIVDMCGTTEIDEAGREALLDLLSKREKDARAVVCLEGLDSEQVGMFPGGPPFYQNKATALAGLGDVSDAPPLQTPVLTE